jgi:membrane-bound metal-dependent hydrolase YbcI (DUF457 family)
MDNATHSLFALTLARTPLARAGRGTTAALLIASNAPDADIVTWLGSGSSYLDWHRGPTHGPLGVIGLGLTAAAIVWIAERFAGPFGAVGDAAAPGRTRASYAGLFAVSLVGVLGHILMDLPTSYGTRVLSPFSSRWFALDWMPIIDIYLLAILAGGLILGLRSEQARRKSAAVVLALMAANYGARALAHHSALTLTQQAFASTLPPLCDGVDSLSLVDSWPRPSLAKVDGTCVSDLAALPSFFSPFQWRVIARLPDAYNEYEIDILDTDLRHGVAPAAAATRVPNVWTPVVAEAASTPRVQSLLRFSRLPLARVVTDPAGGVTVTFNDMRFAAGIANPRLQARRTALFTVTVKMDGN